MSSFIKTPTLQKAIEIIKKLGDEGKFAEYVSGGVIVFRSLEEWKSWKNNPEKPVVKKDHYRRSVIRT